LLSDNEMSSRRDYECGRCGQTICSKKFEAYFAVLSVRMRHPKSDHNSD
jgi:hypothetical protein